MNKLKIAAILLIILVGLLALNYFLDNKKSMEKQNQEEQLKTMALGAESMKGYWHGDENPQINFEKVEVGDEAAVVEFSYPAEGIIAKISFKKSGDTWQISDEEVVER